jgi:hypothetical protein
LFQPKTVEEYNNFLKLASKFPNLLDTFSHSLQGGAGGSGQPASSGSSLLEIIDSYTAIGNEATYTIDPTDVFDEANDAYWLTEIFLIPSASTAELTATINGSSSSVYQSYGSKMYNTFIGLVAAMQPEFLFADTSVAEINSFIHGYIKWNSMAGQLYRNTFSSEIKSSSGAVNYKMAGFYNNPTQTVLDYIDITLSKDWEAGSKIVTYRKSLV